MGCVCKHENKVSCERVQLLLLYRYYCTCTVFRFIFETIIGMHALKEMRKAEGARASFSTMISSN